MKLTEYDVEGTDGRLLGHVTHQLGTDYLLVNPADGVDDDQLRQFDSRVAAIAESLGIAQGRVLRGREAT